jgi:Rrf2 family protein
MIVSTKGRYALRVLIDLAEHDTEGYIPLKEIAQRQGISEKYLESILKILVKNHLLAGMRGKGGGYMLTQKPAEYSIGSVLRLTEDGLAPVSCLDNGVSDCPRRDTCHTLPMWRKLDDMINGFLDSVTLADLMESPENQNFDEG